MKTYTYKLCFFGSGGVGKTTLTRSYLTGLFEENIKFTMGENVEKVFKIIVIEVMKIFDIMI